MKRFLKSALILLLILAVIVVSNTLSIASNQPAPENRTLVQVPDNAIQKLSESIQIRTISPEDPKDFQPEEFERFQEFLKASFPLVEQHLSKTIVSNYSVLYEWKGRNSSLKPALFMGHLDVVPIEPGTEKDWKHPPYSGTISDGFIWGRGSIDDKVNVIGGLEAVEQLLATGYQPERSIFLAYGHDEELSGTAGALQISRILHDRNLTLEFVIDEGLFILEGSMPGIEKPVAFVGIAEKGYLDLELVVRSKGGHSSSPPAETAVGILSNAIAKFESDPFPASIKGAVSQMFDAAAPEMSFGFKLLFANRWLFSPIILSELSGAGTTNAMIRTTTAPTMLSGSLKSNVLPQRVSAIVNFRILPGETIASVTQRVQQVINDPRVEVQQSGDANEPVPPSDIDGVGYQSIVRAVRSIFPGVPVVPSMMIGGTDSKHMAPLSRNIFRFSPMQLNDDELAGFHGTNERLRVDTFKKIVQFYATVIQMADRP